MFIAPVPGLLAVQLMKLYGYDNRGGNNVKTCTKRTCSHSSSSLLLLLLVVVYGIAESTLKQSALERRDTNTPQSPSVTLVLHAYVPLEGVYVLCIYTHASWKIAWATQVSVSVCV